MSRAALAEMTGLNKTTVSSLVRELIEQRYLYEPGNSVSGAGRPAVLVKLNPSAGFILAAEIGCDQLTVVRSDFSGEIVWRHVQSMHASQGPEMILDRLRALLHSAAGLERGKLLGVALAVPGLVDIASGMLAFAPNLHWENVPLGSILASTLDAPVLVDNEANLAAIGEHFMGAAQGCDEVLFISVGIGLGAGILHLGRVCRGATGLAGEVGHMTMDPNGALCACGNRGCWETLAGQEALIRSLCQAVHAGQESRLTELCCGAEPGAALPIIEAAAREGDPAALTAFADVGHQLGIGIASLVNALNPQQVVIGGTLSPAGDLFLPAVEAEVRLRALRWNRDSVRISLARHGRDASIMGGIAAVLEHVLGGLGTAAANDTENRGTIVRGYRTGYEQLAPG